MANIQHESRKMRVAAVFVLIVLAAFAVLGLFAVLLSVRVFVLSASEQKGGGIYGKSWVNGPVSGADEVDIDFPQAEFMENIGSKVDGAGMCVMTSIEHAARWQGMEEYRGLREWCANEPGGGYPQKVDEQLMQFAKARGLPKPRYLQYEGDNPEPVIKAALSSGRMVACTYGYSPRYGGPINHMVNAVKFGGEAVIIDNNLIGGNSREKMYEWMSADTLIARMKTASDRGRFISSRAWVFVWLTPGPPPAPKN